MRSFGVTFILFMTKESFSDFYIMHGISRIKISTIYWKTINRNLLHYFVVKLKMGKEKAGFLTPKAIANRIKAKGLQKLRWYCQMCQKQCRDEVLFCFTMLESQRGSESVEGMGYSESHVFILLYRYHV